MNTEKNSAKDGKMSRRVLEILLRRYASRALDYAHSLAGNNEEAKELVQQASYQVLRNWERYDPLKSFQGWYLTMVKNLYINARMAMSWRRRVSWDEPVQGAERLSWAEKVSDGELGPLEQMERSEQLEAARRALNALSDEHKAVLTSCDIEGASYEETARVLGIPTGTVRSRLFRARAFLRCDPGVRRTV
jgi:RNA polymerase sigma-70 factor (ECF subfamily)